MKVFLFCAVLVTASLAGFGIANAAPVHDILLAGGGDFLKDMVLAGMMMPAAEITSRILPGLDGRARGVLSVRADRTAEQVLAELQTAFEAFKAANDDRLKGIDKKFDDVVQNEKVERINTSITELQAELRKLNADLAAARIGGGGPGETAEVAAHRLGFSQFFRKGIEAGLRELEVKAAMKAGSDPDGGYLVPEQMEATITQLLRTVSAVRSVARVITSSAGVYKKLVSTQGATSGWVGEGESRPQTDTSRLSALDFPSKELYGMPAATQTVLDDAAINIETWLGDELKFVFAEQEGAAFVNGDGVDRPRGILQYPKVANASYAWGKTGFIISGAAGAFDSTDPMDRLINLVHALKSGYRTNARWLMNDLSTSVIRKFKDGEGNYLWQPSNAAGVPPTLLGYPVLTDDNMPDISAGLFPIAFADFMAAYLIVDRAGIRVLRDPYTAKPYVLFYTTKRVGGGIQNFEAIKLLKVSAS